TFTYTNCFMDPLTFAVLRVQPAGAVRPLGVPATVIPATNTSFATTPVGRAIEIVFAAVVMTVWAEDRKRIFALTVQVKLLLSEADPSLAETWTVYVGVSAPGPTVIVPPIKPVPGLIDRPGGSPVAE